MQRAEEEYHPVRHGTMMARGADRHPDGALAPYTPTPRRIRQQGRRLLTPPPRGAIDASCCRCMLRGAALAPPPSGGDPEDLMDADLPLSISTSQQPSTVPS